MVIKAIAKIPYTDAFAKQTASQSARVEPSPDVQAKRSASTQSDSLKLRLSKLAALAATLSALPKSTHSFANPPVGGIPPRGSRVAFVHRQLIQSSEESRHPSAGFSLPKLRGKNTDDVEEFDDFGDQSVGGLPESNIGDPESFLNKFRTGDGGEFDEAALRVYGYTQQLEIGLAELKNASEEPVVHLSKLNALASVCVDLLKLLCEIPPDQQNLPAISEIRNSYLSQLDGLFQSSGDGAGRKNYLHKIEQTYAGAGGISALDSVPGRMLAHLSAHLQPEINEQIRDPRHDLAVTGRSMRSTLIPILERHRKMHERQAGLETLSGNHAQAAELLQKCADSALLAKHIWDPDDTSSEHVALNFNLLKSQILAEDDDAVGTLEGLYMTMLAFAQEHEDHFSADFAQDKFLKDLDDAYSAFLEEVDNGGMRASLDHPIARLFVSADKHGVFDGSA